MSSAGEKYSRCPDCGRKSVYFRALRNGEDNYQCRHRGCDFFFFTMSGAKVDRENEARWQQANAGVPEVRRQTESGQSPMLSGDSEDGGGVKR